MLKKRDLLQNKKKLLKKELTEKNGLQVLKKTELSPNTAISAKKYGRKSEILRFTHCVTVNI